MGRAFWVEGTEGANALRWEHAWHVGRTEAKWLEQRTERLQEETG